MVFGYRKFFDQRHTGPATTAQDSIVIIQGLMPRSDGVTHAIATPNPALQELVAAAKVSVICRFDIEGGLGRPQKGKAGMGHGKNKGSTGPQGLSHQTEHPFGGLEIEIVEQKDGHGTIASAAGQLGWIGQISHSVV